jgi:hypothetical protein
LPTGETHLERSEEDAGETVMDERVSLRSHLDQSASQTPSGVGDTIAAIAAASIDLSALIADGPLAAIIGQSGGTNPDGDQQKDMDVVADRMMRGASCAGRRGSFRGSGISRNPRSQCAALRSDRSARRVGESGK